MSPDYLALLPRRRLLNQRGHAPVCLFVTWMFSHIPFSHFYLKCFLRQNDQRPDFAFTVEQDRKNLKPGRHSPNPQAVNACLSLRTDFTHHLQVCKAHLQTRPAEAGGAESSVFLHVLVCTTLLLQVFTEANGCELCIRVKEEELSLLA